MANLGERFKEASLQWRLTPPEIYPVRNGWLLLWYDAAADRHDYRIATSAEEVRDMLREWADGTNEAKVNA